MDWKRISGKKQEIDRSVKEEIMSHWINMDNVESIPGIIRRFLPDQVDFFILYYESDSELTNDHCFALDRLSDCKDNPVHVTGTMDAMNSPDYRHLYDKNGWRTVVYILMNIIHEPVPNPSADDSRRLGFQVPGMLISKNPDALSEDELERVLTILDIALSAMLLRIGVTFYASRSQQLWESIPGALLLVSPDYVFEANDEAKRWFNLDISPRNPLELGSILPERICRWIAATIGTAGVYTAEEGNSTFWLSENLRVSAGLRPYRPWEKIQLSKKMVTGYKGIETEHINTRLHLLLLRDITREWKADILDQEIRLARHMQIGLQPESMPQSEFLDVAATCQPAHNIGGDLYDAIILDDNRIAMVIGDATGHGIDSALLAALVSGAFRSSVVTDPDPAAVLSSIDGVLRRTNQHGFVTLIYMLFAPDGTSFRYGLAGHYPPMVIGRNELWLENATPSSLPLGVNLPPSYHFEEVNLHPGDIVAAFSDGILECRNLGGELFQQQIPEIILNLAEDHVQTMMNVLLKKAGDFAVGGIHQDDLTMILVRVKDKDRSPLPERKSSRTVGRARS